MNSRDMFQLAVRILGLVFLYQALHAIPVAFSLLVHAPAVSEPPSFFGRLVSTLVMVGWPLLLAWWLVRGAPLLMRIAFRERGG